MKLSGLDLSLTSTGVATWYSPGRILTETVQPKVTPDQPHYHHVRLARLMTEVGGLCRDSDLVAIEGPSYGSPNRQHELGGLWWLVAHGLYRRGIPYAIITPQQRAKYITGKANSGKVAVAVAAARRFPDVDIDGDDEADALVLVAMLADYLGLPEIPKVPEAQRAVLDRIDWPEAFIECREALHAQAATVR